MKITKKYLQDIIKEEIEAVLAENWPIQSGDINDMSEEDMRAAGAKWCKDAYWDQCANVDDSSESCQLLTKVYRELNPSGSI